MAMNKTERAAFEKLQEDLRIAKALRWTGPAPTPDLQPPTGYGRELVKGFLYNAHSERVGPACTTSVSHNSWGNDDMNMSQGSRALFSTRLRAAQAMRTEVELECAKKLAAIDEMIEEESEAFALANSPQAVHNYLKEH